MGDNFCCTVVVLTPRFRVNFAVMVCWEIDGARKILDCLTRVLKHESFGQFSYRVQLPPAVLFMMSNFLQPMETNNMVQDIFVFQCRHRSTGNKTMTKN